MVHRAGGVGGLRLFEGLLNEGAYQETIKDIHTRVVCDTVANLSLNRVLVRPPPTICQAKSRLPHQSCIVLSQLPATVPVRRTISSE